MAMMKKVVATTIVCKAMNPFLTRDLLRKQDGKVVPIEGADKVRISDVLLELHDQDRKFGLHVIDNIMETTYALSEKAGYVAALSRQELREGEYATIKEFARFLRGGALQL